MREIRQSGSEGGGAPWRSLPLLVLSRLRRSGRMRWRLVHAALRLEEYGEVS